MSKVTFASLKLKTNTDVKTIAIGDSTIEVKQYLPVEDKVDLIETALQKAEKNGIYNDILLDTYFHLNLIYLYTNISFTDKQREDETKLFDILESNRIIDNVIEAMPDGEYEELVDRLEKMEKTILKYRNTAGAVLQSIIQDLPKNAATAKEIVDSFDPKQYKAVVDFATAANGNRNIVTNQPIGDNVVSFPETNS